ncbi:MAG: AAA family ATPase [Luteimonas sp.]|nr:AAA family ATPase [Luteimonas sp.]
MNQPTNITQIHAHADQGKSLRELVRDALETDPSISQQKIAREIGTGVSAPTLSQWLNGNYTGDNDKIEQRVRSWYDTYLERRARAGLPDAPGFFETTTTERIESTLRYGQLAQDMVVIVGPAGVSKSATCAQYCIIAPSVYMATMTPATASVLGCLRAIATSMGIRDVPATGSGIQDVIVAKLRGSNGLLIVDEAQHLSIQALDMVRSLHDATLVGIALVGNEYVYTRMTGGRRAPYLDRLYSRIGKRLALRLPNDADVDALIAAWKITDSACRAHIRAIAEKPGALRSVTKVLRLASATAAASDRALTAADVQAATRDLGVLE